MVRSADGASIYHATEIEPAVLALQLNTRPPRHRVKLGHLSEKNTSNNMYLLLRLVYNGYRFFGD